VTRFTLITGESVLVSSPS